MIGIKPIHLQSGDERAKNISYEDCCIDIGAKSKEESKQHVKLGEYAVFTTEFGPFGAAYNVKADIGIALEGTICADMPGVPKHLRATEVGKGPAVSIMDKTSIFNADIARAIMKVAEDKGTPCQQRRAIAGGNDAGAIHMSGESAKVATVSVPCRYIHSSVSVASLNDYENTIKLLVEYLKTVK